MAVAILFQSDSRALRAVQTWRQTFVIPTPSGAKVFSRTTDGTRGPKNAWRENAPEYDADETITAPGVGVLLAVNDYTSLERQGFSSVLAQKAVQALSKVIDEDGPDTRPAAFLAEITDAVECQDHRVAAFVRDKRRKNPLVLTATAPVGAVTPVPVTPAHVAPVKLAAAPVAPIPAASSDVQLATVPDPALGTRYISRDLDGVKDIAVLDYALKCRRNVLLLGPTGSGKTTLPLAWSAIRGRRCYAVSGNQSVEPSQLFGKYVPDGVGGFVWVDGPVTEIVRNGGTLILDEVNFISPKIATVLFPLLDTRREITLLDHYGEVIDAHDNLLIVATGNLGYRGTNILNEAFVNRFTVQREWGYDDNVERKLIRSRALREMVNAIRAQADSAGIETPLGTNVMLELEEVAKELGWDFARANFLQRFTPGDERMAVEIVVNTYADNIRGDLGLDETAPATHNDPDEDDDAPGADPTPDDTTDDDDDEPAPWE